MTEPDNFLKPLKEVQPPPGFERRVLRRMDASRRPRFFSARVAFGSLTAVALAMLLIYLEPPRPSRGPETAVSVVEPMTESEIEEASAEILFGGDLESGDLVVALAEVESEFDENGD